MWHGIAHNNKVTEIIMLINAKNVILSPLKQTKYFHTQKKIL